MSDRYPFATGPLTTGAARLVLASGSPRRRELLGLLGIEFDVVPADADETPRAHEDADAMVRRLAASKAIAVSTVTPGALVIGSDTAVEIDGDILGKPTDAEDAAQMLRRLSGRTHRVHTAVAISRDTAIVAADGTISSVTFVEMSDAAIEWYVATGEPLDKAGGYGLQGIGATFVSTLDGSVTGVLGLPLDLVVDLLTRAG